MKDKDEYYHFTKEYIKAPIQNQNSNLGISDLCVERQEMDSGQGPQQPAPFPNS